MASSKHNDVLYNAAVAGITAGVLAGEDYAQISAATLASAAGLIQQAQIAAAALAVDTAIPFDATLSVSSSDGTLLVTGFTTPTAAAILPVLSKPAVLAQLCESAFRGRSLQLNNGGYTVLVAGIAAQYTAAVAQLAAS